jgi:hypothetical protein
MQRNFRRTIETRGNDGTPYSGRSGDSRILLAMALFALLFVSSGCGLVSRLGRMLLRVAGLGLLDWLFYSALLRWRGLTLPIAEKCSCPRLGDTQLRTKTA